MCKSVVFLTGINVCFSKSRSGEPKKAGNISARSWRYVDCHRSKGFQRGSNGSTQKKEVHRMDLEDQIRSENSMSEPMLEPGFHVGLLTEKVSWRPSRLRTTPFSHSCNFAFIQPRSHSISRPFKLRATSRSFIFKCARPHTQSTSHSTWHYQISQTACRWWKVEVESRLSRFCVQKVRVHVRTACKEALQVTLALCFAPAW